VDHELRRLATADQATVHFPRLAHRHVRVLLAVQNQERGRHPSEMADCGPLGVELAAFRRRAAEGGRDQPRSVGLAVEAFPVHYAAAIDGATEAVGLRRSEEHTSELQSRSDLVCRLLLE